MDLRSYLSLCEERGELQRVGGAGVAEEIGALSEFNAKRASPKTMLFDDIPGYPASWGVVTGALASPTTLGLALGMDTSSIEGLLTVLRGGQFQRWVSQAASFPATKIDHHESDLRASAISRADLNVRSFPSPIWHPNDGGRYIGTGCVVLTRHADSGWVNAGAYRVMVAGHDRLALWMATSRHGRAHLESWWRRGEACPIVVVPGGDPLLVMLAGAAIPEGVSELDVAGAIRGESIRSLEGEATGLPIPADSDVAFEGFVAPNDRCKEGPFGEFTGYYAGGAQEVPAITVTNTYTRDSPLILGAAMGKPPHDFELPFVVLLASLIYDSLAGAGVTSVKGVWIFYGRQMIVTSLKQEHPGHARQAAHVAAHCGAGAYMARYSVAVDEDIDPTNLHEVMWAIMTRSDPATDIDLARRGWGSPIDPVGHFVPEGDRYNSRVLIDACIPHDKRESFPKVAAVERAKLQVVAEKFGLIA